MPWSMPLGLLRLGLCAPAVSQADTCNPRDTLLVQRGAVLVSGRNHPPALTGLYLLGTQARDAQSAARAPGAGPYAGPSAAWGVRRGRAAAEANGSQEAAQGFEGALITARPVVVLRMDGALGEQPQAWQSAADARGVNNASAGFGNGTSSNLNGAQTPRKRSRGPYAEQDSHRCPWHDFHPDSSRVRSVGIMDGIGSLTRCALAVSQRLLRSFMAWRQQVGLLPNHTLPSWSPGLLQAGNHVGYIHPVNFVLPLLGFGALAAIVVALLVRFEPEFGPQQAAPRERPSVKNEQQATHSARSLPSPLPSMRSCGPPSQRQLSQRQLSQRQLSQRQLSLGAGSSRAGTLPCLRSEASLPPPREGGVQHLCPSLVVPPGMELLFAVRDVLRRERQQLSFCIVSLQGQPLSHVIVNERGNACGIQLQMLDQRPLATVFTKPVHDCPLGPPEVQGPSGELFCSIVKTEAFDGGQHMYALQRPSGQRILSIQGDFRGKCMHVVNSAGHLVCDTERCSIDFDSSPHYQVRVAPGIDAGLVLCGLLAVDKVEGGSRAQ